MEVHASSDATIATLMTCLSHLCRCRCQPHDNRVVATGNAGRCSFKAEHAMQERAVLQLCLLCAHTLPLRAHVASV